jgi:2-desacetyl-2-hydroxyethyl bacteriochlorophyllide A dehydrogenase
MKVLVCIRPGEFEYREMDAPLAGPGQAIIKIKRIGICGTDLHAFEGTQPYFEYPRILGHELSGDLVDFDQAPGFLIGEAVTVIPYCSCGHCIACRNGKTNCCVSLSVLGVHIDGGMVEYLSVPSALLVHGQGLSYDELAMVEPFAIGAHAIRRAAVIPGEFVLVVGAGPIGLGVMESARIAGGQVIAMDIQEERLRYCRDSLQILHTVNAGIPAIDGGTPDISGQLSRITGGDMPTLVIDATGSRKAINDGFQYLSHGGRYVLVGLQKGEICVSHPEFHKREATLMSSRNATREDFAFVMEAMAAGRIVPGNYITHRASFGDVKDVFTSWMDPKTGVIKAMVEMG